MIVVLLALGAAVVFGISQVLMHAKAREAPAEKSLRVGLLVHLARQRSWLLGGALQMVGFGLQAVALSKGSLVLVMAIGPTSLLFALPLASRVSAKRLGRVEWAGAAATVVGLAVFLLVTSPGEGSSAASAHAWLVLMPVCLGAAAALVVLGRPLTGPLRAVTLGTAAGTVLGLTGAVTKGAAERFQHGIGPGFSGWEPYALAGLGLLGLTLVQSAFQAGDIEWSLPAVTVTHPFVSIIAGATAFHEALDVAGVHAAGALVGVAAMATGIWLLARSPALVAMHDPALAG